MLSSSSSGPPQPACGNGELEAGETCEPPGTAQCDDACQTINTEHEDRCTNLRDEDSDGLVDCQDPDCAVTAACIPGSTPTGDACTAHTDCVAQGNDPLCLLESATGFPGGACSESCGAGLGPCAQGVCVPTAAGAATGRCLADCSVAGCRSGYACTDVLVAPGEQVAVCLPACTGSGQCGGGRVCDVPSGSCVSEVAGNHAPSLDGVTLAPVEARAGSTLECAPGTPQDADGDPVSLGFAWQVNGVWVFLDSSTLPNAWWRRGDAVACSVTPTDGKTAGLRVRSNLVTIGNTAPGITGVVVEPAAPVVTSTLQCRTAGYTDADGDAEASTYEWSIQGNEVGTGPSLAQAFLRGDVVVCRATPSDGTDVGTAASASVTIGNSAPVVDGAAITPAQPRVVDTPRCEPGTVTDADGDEPVTLRYAWSINGTDVGVVAATLPAGLLSRGDAVVCTVVPWDGLDSGAAVTAPAQTVQNAAPTASQLELTPSQPRTDDVLTVLGVLEDPDGDAVSAAYRWFINGNVADFTGSALPGTYFSRGDGITAEVTPWDGFTAGAAVVSGPVTVVDSAPSAAGAVLSPAVAYVDTPVNCAAAGFQDADGDADLSTVAWTVNGLAAGTGPTLAGAFLSGDLVQCVLTPQDGTLAGAPVVSPVLAISNSPPVLQAVTLEPSPAFKTSTLTCTPGTVTDADGTAAFTFTYAWTVNGESITPVAQTLDGASFKRGDTVRCTATPHDGTGAGAAVASAEVTISNSPPVVSRVDLSSLAPGTNDELLATVSGADADADAVSFTYQWQVNGADVAATGSTLSGMGFFNRGDTVRVRVTPFDGTVAGAPVLSAVATVANSIPSIASAAITPDTAWAGSVLSCAVSGYADADGDASATQLAWLVNGAAVGTGATFSGALRRADTVVCRATAHDGTDAGNTVDSATLTVSNTAPVLASASLTPTTADEGSTLTCTPGTATDADGDAVSYTYAWYVNGSAVPATSSTLTGASFSRGNAVYCRVTPSDGRTSGTAVSSATVTISNSPPALAGATLTPDPAYEPSTLSCVPGVATDMDGDAIIFTYSWYVNGSVVAATGSTLMGTSFSKGNTVYCRVTPSDGASSGAAVSSNTVTITNSAPVVSAVTLTPTTAYEASTLSCTPTGTDADGDALSYTYAWYVNGSAVAATTSTLTGTYFSKGNTVYCRVVPSDGTSSGAAASSSTVTISNTAPVVSAVSLTPTTAYEASTLSCTPAGTDADGDALSYTYAWYVNGSAVAATTSTLTGTYFSKGNTVYCRVVPLDGTASGSAVSSSTVVISNTAPVAPVVAILPAQPSAAVDPLVCSITTPATDADGDALTYAFTWTRNGTAYAGASSTATTSTVPAAATVLGDGFVCRVTASDGTASSPPSTALVTVLGPEYYIGYHDPFPTPEVGFASPGYALGHRVTVSSTATLYRLGLYMRLEGTGQGRMALYTDSAGAPGTLVAYTAPAALPQGHVEMDVVGAPIVVPAGTYWLVANYSAAAYLGYTAVGASANVVSYRTLAFGSAFPASFGAASTYMGQFINYYLVVR